MNTLAENTLRIIGTGAGATLMLDGWLLLLQGLGLPTLNFALLGRWVGHMRHGQWQHEAIAKAAPVAGETALGWLAHYVIGITFAAALHLLAGTAWIHSPKLLPALLFGMVTVAAPLLIMQPAMGAGLFASHTPTPLLNCLKSLVNHSVFGIALYLSARAINIAF